MKVPSDCIAEMASELESTIQQEIIATGEQILLEYQEKLSKFDEDAGEQQLDFNTVDLIKGALTNMRENAEAWCSDQFSAETIDNIGETTYEEKTYYEKVGQEEEEIIVGTHEEVVGTERVRTGSHQESRTRQVRNPRKKWFTFWRADTVEEQYYETVDDYEDREILKTVNDYQTVVRDIFEKRTETIERFSANVADIQAGLVAAIRENLDNGIDNALEYSMEQTDKIKKQFMGMFDELDQQIVKKYDELKECASDSEENKARLEKNTKILRWIEESNSEINALLDL